METVAFLGLMGLGYLAAPKEKTEKPETFANPTSSNDASKKKIGKTLTDDLDLQFTIPLRGDIPSEPNPDQMQGNYFQYATKKPNKVPAVPHTPNPSMGKQSNNVQLRPDAVETATRRKGFVSPLSGIEFKDGEFKHANMVPFFRGQVKQNMADTANSQTLDAFTGTGFAQYAKREQTPFFEPTKTPVGNPFGMEATTEFMTTRINEPMNRANEAPMESIRVGPGLNQGFTHIPSGGFQQQDGEEYVIHRMPRTDDLRVASKPKVTYDTPLISGAHFIKASGTAETVGEVRKYQPDRYYINENGERNFITTGADQKATVRSAQVLKNTTRMATTREYAGHAGQAEGNATYTVAAAKAPLVKQHGPFGYRNADASSYFNADTDADQNDYGKKGVEIRPNERFYTGERVHATNIAADKRGVTVPLQDGARQTRAEELIDNIRGTGNFTAMGGGLPAKQTVYDPTDIPRTTIKETTIDGDWLGMAAPTEAQPRLTVYDPSDIPRTTIKETTIDGDWLGMAAPADAQPRLTVYDPNDVARTTIKETTLDGDYVGVVGVAGQPQKLTVYDPDDVARVTGRNTLADWDLYRNMGRQDLPAKATNRLQDPVKNTQKAAISAKSAYTGGAESSAKWETSRTAAAAMRHYAQKENIAKGRAPTNSGTKVFNGEDYVSLQYRKLFNDSVNDREPGSDRVNSEPTSVDMIGIQRPRAALKLDVSAVRNEPVYVESLEKNPYNISLHQIAGRL